MRKTEQEERYASTNLTESMMIGRSIQQPSVLASVGMNAYLQQYSTAQSSIVCSSTIESPSSTEDALVHYFALSTKENTS